MRIFKNRKMGVEQALQKIENAYNAGFNRTLGTSPANLQLGYNPIDPFQKRTEFDNEEIYSKIKESAEAENKKKNTKRINTGGYNKGEYILLKNLEQGKLNLKWKGAFEVLAIKRNKDVIQIKANKKELNLIT
eukprot:GAHX01003171.1.p1 GENE.GAHX01003171.1~~GAHX01003171.1.p1  ORF type:complete len:133 (-),score=31.71 GAHX01003171.1:130-528(-)